MTFKSRELQVSHLIPINMDTDQRGFHVSFTERKSLRFIQDIQNFGKTVLLDLIRYLRISLELL